MAYSLKHIAILLLLHMAHFFPFSHATFEQDKPRPLVPDDGKGSNNWLFWIDDDYLVDDQCFTTPEHPDKKIHPNRIFFYCSNGQPCSGARLVICYPSMLDPDVFPDEMNENGIPPERRAYRPKWITNDADSEITKKCAEMMGRCQANGECKKTLSEMAQEFNETWHGFMVRREAGGFVIELPWKNASIPLPDDKEQGWPPRFYLNFGNDKNAEHSYITIPTRTTDLKKHYGDENKKALIVYRKHRGQGIPLDKAKHLWVLGTDILPPEEIQKIRFYTLGFPANAENACIKNETELSLEWGKETKLLYINATYLKPYTEDSDVQLKLSDAEKKIKVRDAHGHVYSEEIKYPYTRFFINGHVPFKASSFEIKMVVGRKDATEESALGIVAFNLNVTKQNCTINVYKNAEQPCDFIINSERSFWLLVDTKQGNVSMNCQNHNFTDQLIPYSEETYFIFNGDIELYKYDAHFAVQKEEEKEKAEVSPVLIIEEINVDVANYLIISGHMGQKAKMIVEIRLVNNGSQVFERFFASNCAGKIDCTVLPCEKNCLGAEFNFILDLDENNGGVYLDGKKEDIKIDIAEVRKSNYVQINGDLHFPIVAKPLKTLAATEMKNQIGKMLAYNYIIVHGLVLGDTNFKLEFQCEKNECYDKFTRTLIVDFDLSKKTAIADSVWEEEGKEHRDQVASSDFPLKLGKPFWIKISFSDSESKYHIHINGNIDPYLKIATQYYHLRNLPTSIVLVDKVKLLDKISRLPFPLDLGEDRKEKRINVRFNALENGTKFELFVVHSGSIETLETDKFDGVIFVHILAQFGSNLGSGRICVGSGLQKIQFTQGNKIECANSKAHIVTISQTEFNIGMHISEKKAEVAINGSPIVVDMKLQEDKTVRDANYFVIRGDISFLDEPKCTDVHGASCVKQ